MTRSALETSLHALTATLDKEEAQVKDLHEQVREGQRAQQATEEQLVAQRAETEKERLHASQLAEEGSRVESLLRTAKDALLVR